MSSMSIKTTYEVIDCPNCGVLFAITEELQTRRLDDGKSFYCPFGHTMSYSDTTQKRLLAEREKSARLTARLDQVRADRDAERRRASAARGQVTKIRNRVANGVCPCCNRTFPDLAAHMKTKHPDYAEVTK